VASNDKGEVLFWDLATGHRSTPLSGQTATVWSVAFSPDGQTLATASADHTVGLWDLTSQRSKGRLKGHGGIVRSVAFSPDGKRLVSASDDETLKLWSAKPKEETERTAADWVLSPSSDTMARQGRPQGIGFGVFVFSEDGLRMAVPGGDGVNVWDLATKQILSTITNEFRALALTESGRTLVTITTNYALAFWDWERQLPRTNFVLSTTNEPIRTAQLDPGGKVLATATRGGRVSFWNPANGSSLGAIQANRGIVGLAFSPDGRFVASAGADATGKIWEVSASGLKLHRTLRGHLGYMFSLQFSPDGRRALSCGSDHTLKLWDTETGLLVGTLYGHRGFVTQATFSRDGNTIYSTGQDCEVRIWQAPPLERPEASGCQTASETPEPHVNSTNN
jgi:WD40 repeat protein